MKTKLLLAFITCALTMQAQDRLFTYTYQSTVINKNQKEIEFWSTLKTGKTNFYSRLDNRLEYEIGLGNNIQTAFYLNQSMVTRSIEVENTKSLKSENKISFSNEWKWKLLDPVADPVGIALYGELGVGGKEYELESKLIIDKKIHNLIIATNFIYELEIEAEQEKLEIKWEKKQKTDFHIALAYLLSPRFSLTMENAFRNILEDGKIVHSSLYAGPGFSYVQENFFVNFTALPQIKSFKGQKSGDRINLNAYEKVQFRILFSHVF